MMIMCESEPHLKDFKKNNFKLLNCCQILGNEFKIFANGLQYHYQKFLHNNLFVYQIKDYKALCLQFCKMVLVILVFKNIQIFDLSYWFILLDDCCSFQIVAFHSAIQSKIDLKQTICQVVVNLVAFIVAFLELCLMKLKIRNNCLMVGKSHGFVADLIYQDSFGLFAHAKNGFAFINLYTQGFGLC